MKDIILIPKKSFVGEICNKNTTQYSLFLLLFIFPFYIKLVSTSILHYISFEINYIYPTLFSKWNLYGGNISIYSAFTHITCLPIEIFPSIVMKEHPISVR